MLKGRSSKIAVAAALVVGLCVLLLWHLQWHLDPFWRVTASQSVLANPNNYKPAGRAMARLLMTNPVLLGDEANELPPAWLPSDIGRVGPLEVGIDKDQKGMWLSTTGGLGGFNGYVLDWKPGSDIETVDHFTLSTRGLDNSDDSHVVEQFSLPKGSGYTEDELVRNGLAELDRRKAARANKTDPAVSYDMSDADADRCRLLYEHPAIAQKLGLPIPAISTTHPAGVIH